MDLFPNVAAVVLNARADGLAEALIQHITIAHPTVKRVLTGSKSDLLTSVDLHIETYSPDALLEGLRKLFPEDSAIAESIERKLQDRVPPEQ